MTGGRGLLGGGLAQALIARGDDVTVLQRHPSGLACREVLGDIRDAAGLAAAARGQDAVVHLAARVQVVGRWREFHDVNVVGTRNALEAARGASVRAFVHVSTPSVAHAGSALMGVGAAAADPGRARGNYARSKAVAERTALAADGPDLAVLAVRPHLVWGPGDSQLVGRIIQRARAGRLALVGTGAALIDTTYVDNAVAALVCAVDRCDVAHGQALVVSNGEPRPVGELVAAICRATGVRPPRRHVPLAVAWSAGALVEAAWSGLGLGAEPPMTRFLASQLATAHWFDQRRTRALLGWRPAVSLDEGLRRLAAAGHSPAP